MQGGLIGRRPVLPPMADEEDVLDQPRALEGVVQVDGHLLEQLRVAQLLHSLQLRGGGAQHGGAGQKVEGGFVRVPRSHLCGRRVNAQSTLVEKVLEECRPVGRRLLGRRPVGRRLLGRRLVRRRLVPPVSKRTGERTLLALSSGAQYGAPPSQALIRHHEARGHTAWEDGKAVSGRRGSSALAEDADGVGRPGGAAECS